MAWFVQCVLKRKNTDIFYVKGFFLLLTEKVPGYLSLIVPCISFLEDNSSKKIFNTSFSFFRKGKFLQ